MDDQSFFAISLTVAFALLGYLMRKLGYPFVPFIIGFVLTPMLELSISQAMIITGGSVEALLKYPVALIFLALTLFVVLRAAFRAPRPKETSNPEA